MYDQKLHHFKYYKYYDEKSKSFANISTFCEIIVADRDICNHYQRIKIQPRVQHLFLFFIIVFNMMKFLAKVEAAQTMIKESHKVTSRLNCMQRSLQMNPK